MKKTIATLAICGLVTALSSCASYYPPGTNRDCVSDIYQTYTSGGAPIYESYNVTLHSPTDGTPGITYKTNSAMRASADGKIYDIIILRTGRAGGKMVTVSHGRSIYTMYAHLGRVKVKMGQSVKRGDAIGWPDSLGYPKLLLKIYGNWESPDNWGPGHDLMVSRKDLPDKYNNMQLVEEAYYMEPFMKRFKIIENLYNILGVPKIKWYARKHNPNRRSDAIAPWSLVEHSRYLKCIAENDLDRFKGKTLDYVNEEINKFNRLQYLVLTKPF